MPTEVSAPPENQPAAQPAANPTPQPSARERELESQVAAERQRYQQDMAQVAEWAKTLVPQAPAAPAEPEDDSALIDRRELKRVTEDLKRTVAGVITETTAQGARSIRAANAQQLAGKLKNYDRYAAEIDGLLDKMDPRLAANQETITQVYKVVRAKYHDQEVEEEVARRMAERPAREEGDEDYESERPEPGAGSVGVPTARPQGGVAPSGDASASRPQQSRREAKTPLSRDERVIAGIFGIQSSEEYRRLQDPTYKPDFFGFKGKSRI